MEKSNIQMVLQAGTIRSLVKLFLKRFFQRTVPRAFVGMTSVGGAFDYQAQFHHMEPDVIGQEIPVEAIEMLDIANALPHNPSKSYPRRDPLIVKGYVVHHTGAPPQSFELIAKYHIRKKGWAGIAYHFGISQGKILILNDISVISNHTSGMNSRNVGVVVIGDYRKAMPSEEDLKALEYLDHFLAGKGITNMTWHRAVKATECPGDSLIQFLKSMDRNEELIAERR